MCDYYNQNQYYLIRVPNVLNSFGETLHVSSDLNVHHLAYNPWPVAQICRMALPSEPLTIPISLIVNARNYQIPSEATTAAIGVAVILLSVLLIRSLRLPCNGTNKPHRCHSKRFSDSSKPFLLMLSLGMALATVASIVLFLYRTCYLSTDL